MKAFDWVVMLLVLFLCVFQSWYWLIMAAIWIGLILVERKWVNDDWSKT